ncbi:MAG: glycosyltransferase [Bacteroidales bacterium]|jgi:glycosyltransferase involved in cell wall biosynthesis|nr:glycosyltransferase [Bacteroidales bacterium]
MLSIAIPIYNFNVSDLVSKLAFEIDRKKLPAELILIDDASSSEFKALNEACCSRFTYIQLEKNVGRSRIRNLFVQYARYDYLLFLDCDSCIRQDDFLEKYLKIIAEHKTQVVCGGNKYPDEKPSRKYRLAWNYRHTKQSKNAAQRNLTPNHSFMTNNFVIHKALLSKIPFEERLLYYGHEDTLMGYQLLQNNISIYHIDNEVIDKDIQTNIAYLDKTEMAVKNLWQIIQWVDDKERFVESVKLLRFYKKLNHYPVGKSLFRCFFWIKKPFIKWWLQTGYGSLWLLNVYKLGVLMEYEK